MSHPVLGEHPFSNAPYRCTVYVLRNKVISLKGHFQVDVSTRTLQRVYNSSLGSRIAVYLTDIYFSGITLLCLVFSRSIRHSATWIGSQNSCLGELKSARPPWRESIDIEQNAANFQDNTIRFITKEKE